MGVSAPCGSLTPKQEAFVLEYLLDKNGTQAAIRAGYSPRTASEQAARLLGNVKVRAAVDAAIADVARKTETEVEWVRRRLREEAEDRGFGTSQTGRVRALEIIAKLNGMYELDNKQRADALGDLLKGLTGNVVGPVPLNLANEE